MRRRARVARKGPEVLDMAIIQQLQEDARVSNASLARELGVSEETVGRHRRRLAREGYIYVTAIADPANLGFKIEALIGICARPDRVDEVAEALAEMKEIGMVLITGGSYNVFAWAALRTKEELSAFLRDEVARIPGVLGQETFISLTNAKRTHCLTM